MERINRNEDMRRAFVKLVREHGVKQIVVGLPPAPGTALAATWPKKWNALPQAACAKQIGVPVGTGG